MILNLKLYGLVFDFNFDLCHRGLWVDDKAELVVNYHPQHITVTRRHDRMIWYKLYNIVVVNVPTRYPIMRDF